MESLNSSELTLKEHRVNKEMKQINKMIEEGKSMRNISSEFNKSSAQISKYKTGSGLQYSLDLDKY